MVNFLSYVGILLLNCTVVLVWWYFVSVQNDVDEHANLMRQICDRTQYIIRSCSATSASFIPQPEAGAKPSSETVNIYVELNFFLFLSASWTQFWTVIMKEYGAVVEVGAASKKRDGISRTWSLALVLMVASALFAMVTFDPLGSSVCLTKIAPHRAK